MNGFLTRTSIRIGFETKYPSYTVGQTCFEKENTCFSTRVVKSGFKNVFRGSLKNWLQEQVLKFNVECSFLSASNGTLEKVYSLSKIFMKCKHKC